MSVKHDMSKIFEILAQFEVQFKHLLNNQKTHVKGVGEGGAAGACAPALSKVGGAQVGLSPPPTFGQTKCSNFSYFVVKKCKIFLARFARQLYFINIFKP